MRRRSVVITGLAALLLAPERSTAQQPKTKIPRVGILTPADSERTPNYDAFREGLRDLGYIEGRDIILEFRLARGDFTLLPKLAAELVNLPVDVIVGDGGVTVARVAMDMTKRIPIIMGAGGDMVTSGLAASLARPGGNLTGFGGMPFGSEQRMGGWERYRPEIFYILCPSTTTSHGRLMADCAWQAGGVRARFDPRAHRPRPGAGRGVLVSLPQTRR
jgi:ABC transporter substrate binding protein